MMLGSYLEQIYLYNIMELEMMRLSDELDVLRKDRDDAVVFFV